VPGALGTYPLSINASMTVTAVVRHQDRVSTPLEQTPVQGLVDLVVLNQ
jgi:hypothetical protein